MVLKKGIKTKTSEDDENNNDATIIAIKEMD